MRFAGLTALRSRALLILVLSVLAAVLSAQTTCLKSGKSIHDELTDGQTRVYSVRLKTNEYLRATVCQPSAAVTISLSAPDGKSALEVNARDGKPAQIVWMADTAGEYRISVRGAGRYQIKIEELHKTRPLDRERVEAERSFTQGVIEARKYAYERAIPFYTRALALYRQVQDRVREEDVLAALGAASYSTSEPEKAIGYYQQELAIARQIKDRSSEGAALKSLGNAYDYLSQLEKAIGYQEQALAVFREVKDRNGEGRALGNLGRAYGSLGQYEKASGYYEQALAISREVKDRQMESLALYSLGAAYTSLSQNEKAIDYQKQALAIARENKDRSGQGMALIALGWVHGVLGQSEKAMSYFKEALAIERDLNDRTGEIATLIDIGTYGGLDDDTSIIYYGQALAVAREVKYRLGEGEALENLGWSYANLKKYEKAIGYCEQALAIEREIKDRQGEGETLSVLGDAYNALSQYEQASGYYAQALVISREVRDRVNEARELSGLMDIWQASGRRRLAIFYGKQAVNTVQSMRSDIRGLGQDLQKSFLKGNEKPYHTLAELLIALGRLAEAEQVLALLKEEEYFEYIRRDAGEASSLNRRADLTADEAEYEKRYREIGDRLMTIGVERGQLLSKKTLTPEQSRRLVQLEQDLAVGNQAFEHFLGDLTQHFSGNPEVNAKVVWQLREEEGFMEDLRELPAGTVAIYTLVGEDKFCMILQTPDAEKAYEYPIKAADLNQKVLDFRQAVKDPRVDPRRLAQELYKIVVGPMAEDLHQARAQTLMWSLDGVLRYLPLAALYDGRQYLIEQYRVSVMTLASNTRLLGRPDVEWKAAGFGVTKAYEDQPALSAVPAELAGIIATKPGDGGVLSGEIKLDGEFTREAMRQTLLKRYPVVHIASHFRFQSGNETQSFLLLGDGAHLTLGELKTSANLFGGVQLLTLSACNTGIGDGTEVEGFGALAQRQGAKAVIASLWPVADESTSRLMQRFYRIRESSPGKTKLEALRDAQLELLHGAGTPTSPAITSRGVHVENSAEKSEAGPFPYSPETRFSHPYYWAPFFLMGNWL